MEVASERRGAGSKMAKVDMNDVHEVGSKVFACVRISWDAVGDLFEPSEFRRGYSWRDLALETHLETAFAAYRAEMPAWAQALTWRDFVVEDFGSDIFLVGPELPAEGPGLASTRPAPLEAPKVA